MQWHVYRFTDQKSVLEAARLLVEGTEKVEVPAISIVYDADQSAWMGIHLAEGVSPVTLEFITVACGEGELQEMDRAEYMRFARGSPAGYLHDGTSYHVWGRYR